MPETCRLAEALSPLLDPENDLTKDCRDKMDVYYSAGISAMCALMKVGEMERNRYIPVHPGTLAHYQLTNLFCGTQPFCLQYFQVSYVRLGHVYQR